MSDTRKTGDKAAFPLAGEAWVNNDTPGMSLREYYAGQALAGLCAASATGARTGNFRDGDDLTRNIVNSAVEAADLLIAELDRTKP